MAHLVETCILINHQIYSTFRIIMFSSQSGTQWCEQALELDKFVFEFQLFQLRNSLGKFSELRKP